MPMNIREGSLGAVLFKSRIISEQDIDAALEEQQRSGVRFGEALLRLGIVTQEDINWALSNQLEIPYIRLRQEMIDPDALTLLPHQLCRSYQLIPLIRAGDELSIAIADPLDKEAVSAAAAAANCRINLSVALPQEISALLDLCYGLQQTEQLGFSSAVLPETTLAAINADLSGKTFLETLLSYSVDHQLNTISLRPLDQQVSIAARKGATTSELGQLALQHYRSLCALIREQAAVPPSAEPSRSGRLSFVHHGRELFFQVLLLAGEQGDYLTIRRQISVTIPDRLAQLNLPPFQTEQFRRLTGLRQGLVLFASRSLQERCRFMDLLLEELPTGDRAVLLLGGEPGRMGKQFPRIPLPANEIARGHLIMDSLEHAPDILVIEDGTSLEPFTAAARAAMRGKLVLVGMDIRGTRNLIDHLLALRRLNAFLTPFLAGIVSFKGIRLLCPACRQPVLLPDQEREALQLTQQPEQFFQAAGCPACEYTGIRERRFLTNCICFDQELQQRLDAAAGGSRFIAELNGSGYRGIRAAGEELLMQGEVSAEEFIAAVLQ